MKRSAVKLRKWHFYAAAVVIAAALVGLRIWSAEKKRMQELITYRVVKQNLFVSVTEGGNLKALKSQKVINLAPGSRNILEVVAEGTQITEEDVKNGKILIKLDKKDLEERAQQLELTVENSYAAYVDAQGNLEIQKKQNETDIAKAELDVKFARMDLEKYLGKTLADQLINGKITAHADLMKSSDLGGEALNKKRDLANKIDLVKEETAHAKDKVEWSEKLASKGYITKSELEADNLAYKQKDVSSEQAKLDDRLFFEYDFPKQVEKLFADYRQALAALERTRANCNSRLIQGETNVKSKKAADMMNRNYLRDVREQIGQCTIKATQPGFVTYASSGRPSWSSENPIQPGTQVRQYQELLNLPDFASMGVEVKLHEAVVEKVKEGMTATVTVDAFPDRKFTGEIKTIALMPDVTLRWMNPDVNVYLVQIALEQDQSSTALKPGMSALAEIHISELDNVLAVPQPAVFKKDGKSACTVMARRKMETRYIELGESNDEMVEVKKGLKEGDTVVFGAAMGGAEKKKNGRNNPAGRNQ